MLNVSVCVWTYLIFGCRNRSLSCFPTLIAALLRETFSHIKGVNNEDFKMHGAQHQMLKI